jgi:hypothetical protein
MQLRLLPDTSAEAGAAVRLGQHAKSWLIAAAVRYLQCQMHVRCEWVT